MGEMCGDNVELREDELTGVGGEDGTTQRVEDGLGIEAPYAMAHEESGVRMPRVLAGFGSPRTQVRARSLSTSRSRGK